MQYRKKILKLDLVDPALFFDGIFLKPCALNPKP